jgi:stress response protein YsnF
MKKYLKTLSSLILIIATVSSCGKKEDEVVPVESDTVSLNYTAVSSNLTNPITVFPITKGQSASITWNKATLKISNLIFSGEEIIFQKNIK